MAARPVLHNKNADDGTATHDRHAKEGMIDFFAGFRQVFEGWMVNGLGEIEANRLPGNQAHEALAHFELGFVNRFALQTLRGIEFQQRARPHDIDRAHLGNHVAGDRRHNLVEPFLRRLLLRHHLAESTEEDTRAECGASHACSSGAHALAAKMFHTSFVCHCSVQALSSP